MNHTLLNAKRESRLCTVCAAAELHTVAFKHISAGEADRQLKVDSSGPEVCVGSESVTRMKLKLNCGTKVTCQQTSKSVLDNKDEAKANDFLKSATFTTSNQRLFSQSLKFIYR